MKSKVLVAIAFALLVGFTIVVSMAHLSEACGPGRGGGRRRMLRKYPPLVQRQYIPNVSENTLGASGRAEGAIKRKERRFRELVQNWNPDIEFRDDEQTGADRMMSQRLKEKLSTLAISVMNQWPNVKLRVIEGWDEDNRHSLNSLHYEGRAVDITTSDRDKSKYGMLARLAVEAGFDWVHYESRSHVHCSVKSEKADTIRNNGCFDSSSLVQTPDGEMEMSQLQTNDLVLTMNLRGQLQYSPIIMWLDREELGQELFVELKTKSNQLIRLTSSHLIYVADEPIDLTSNQLSYVDSSQTPSSLMPTPNSGSNTNNRNNYYYYDTQATLGESNQTLANILNTTSNVNQIQNDSLKPPSIEDVVYTTYARNVVVGQYLLINTPKSPEINIDRANQVEEEDDSLMESPESDKAKYITKDTERHINRLVFSSKMTNRNNERLQDDVQRANSITQTSGGLKPKIKFDQIVSVNYVIRRGIYAPLTREGNVVVNSIVASCYAVISDHDLAHISFAPVRWFSYLQEWLFGLDRRPSPWLRTVDAIKRQRSDNTQIQDTHAQQKFNLNPKSSYKDQFTPISTNHKSTRREIHWYPMMLYRIAKFILPTRYLY